MQTLKYKNKDRKERRKEKRQAFILSHFNTKCEPINKALDSTWQFCKLFGVLLILQYHLNSKVGRTWGNTPLIPSTWEAKEDRSL